MGSRLGRGWLLLLGFMMATTGFAAVAFQGPVVLPASQPAGDVRVSSTPLILNVTPWDGQLIGLKTPTIVVAYTGFGVRIAGVDLHLDGMNLTSAGSFNESAFVLPLALELRDGPHVANFTVVDATLAAAFANWTFVVDTIPPILVVTSPAYPMVPYPAIPVEGSAQVAMPIAAPVTVAVTVLPSRLTLTTTAAADGAFSILTPLTEGVNTLFINATDRIGNLAVAITSIVRDTVPPPLVVVSPMNMSVVGSNIVRVSGLAEFGAYVVVNGINVGVYPNGTWSVDLALSDGLQILPIAAADAVGNTNLTVLGILVDGDVPRLALTSPSAMSTNRSTVVVSGYATDSRLVALFVNGLSTAFDPSTGFFSRELVLPDGTNPIVVVAVDAAQHTTTLSTAVVVDTTAPVVRVTDPLDGLQTNLSSVVVAGTVDDPNATVLVDGQLLRPDADGAWRTTVALVAGENTIEVTAFDAAGNRGPVITKHTTYTPPWPALDDRISDQDRTFSVWGSAMSLALAGVFLLLLVLLVGMYLRLNRRLVELRGVRIVPGEEPRTEDETPQAPEPKSPE